jgi:CRP/FNR family transcriptional regulator, cyclic AMP receptor protein
MTKIAHFAPRRHESLVRKVLDGSPTFRACRPETLEALLVAATLRPIVKSESVDVRGQPLKSLLVLISGSLELSMQTASGKRSVVWYLEPGQLQGLISVIDGKAAIHDARAHSDGLLLEIPRAAFLDALARDPALLQAVLLTLCERSRTLYDVVAGEALLTLRGRIARMLLLLVKAYGRETDAGTQLSLKLSQDEFADLLGVTRQSINRELKAMQHGGFITMAYSRITVVDLAALRQVADVENLGDPPG